VNEQNAAVISTEQRNVDSAVLVEQTVEQANQRNEESAVSVVDATKRDALAEHKVADTTELEAPRTNLNPVGDCDSDRSPST